MKTYHLLGHCYPQNTSNIAFSLEFKWPDMVWPRAEMKYKQSLAEVCSEWTALIGGILLQRVCFPPASPAHGSMFTKHQNAWLPEDNWQVKCHFCSFPTQQLKGQRCCWIWLWQIHTGTHI